MPIKYSFIIPTLDRPKDMGDLLKDLDKIADRGDRHFEVIVFNDGKNLETDALLSRKRDYPIKNLYSESSINSCETRNACLREAIGEWIIFLDDDVRLKDDFLEQVNNYSQNYSAFSFKMELPNRKDRPMPINQLLEQVSLGKIIPILGHFVGGFDKNYGHNVRVDHLPGANMIFKRSLIGNIKFDERIGAGTGYLDDADFSFTVKKCNGIDLTYVPFYSIVHLQTPTGGNRQLDRDEWFYHYQNHKFMFFAKHLPSAYIPFIIFFNFLDAVIRSIIYKTNLIPTFFRALKDAST